MRPPENAFAPVDHIATIAGYRPPACTGAATSEVPSITNFVLIPTLNERECLPQLVPRVLEAADCRVLVIDDDSSDGTAQIADDLSAARPDRIHVQHRRGDKGLGRSYVDGFETALRMGAEFIVQMDADLSHDPRDLPAMLAAACKFDLVVGSRYSLARRAEPWSWTRKWISRGANRYVRTLLRIRVDDCTSGFRCWTRKALECIDLASVRSKGFSIQVEMLHAALAAGCLVGEVPIRFNRRAGGCSKLSLHVVTESVLTPWKLRRSSPTGRGRASAPTSGAGGIQEAAP